jgi:hypothetical protein
MNLSGVIFKVDFEKAYDKVKWPFLQQANRMKGFSPLWCQWIHQFVYGGSIAVKVNNDVGPKQRKAPDKEILYHPLFSI